MRTEFFTDESNLTGDLINLKSNNEYLLFSKMNSDELTRLYISIDDNPKCHEIFKIMRNNGNINFTDMLRQFIACNFGNLDQIPDIDENGSMHFEYVNCGCKHQGCKFGKQYCIIKSKALA